MNVMEICDFLTEREILVETYWLLLLRSRGICRLMLWF